MSTKRTIYIDNNAHELSQAVKDRLGSRSPVNLQFHTSDKFTMAVQLLEFQPDNNGIPVRLEANEEVRLDIRTAGASQSTVTGFSEVAGDDVDAAASESVNIDFTNATKENLADGTITFWNGLGRKHTLYFISADDHTAPKTTKVETKIPVDIRTAATPADIVDAFKAAFDANARGFEAVTDNGDDLDVSIPSEHGNVKDAETNISGDNIFFKRTQEGKAEWGDYTYEATVDLTSVGTDETDYQFVFKVYNTVSTESRTIAVNNTKLIRL